MEVKEERADGREVRESYTMLMETEAIIRNQRTLRREICISRIVIFILLITCMAAFVLLYARQVHGSQNIQNTVKEPANEMISELQRASDVQTPLIASLCIKQQPTSLDRQNLTWWPYNDQLNDFLLDESESLVIPQEGKYRLSLQLTYGEPTGNHDVQSDLHGILFHKIVKYSDSIGWRPVTLLSVQETVHKKIPWFKSVFSEVCGVFNKGDIIKVESENSSLVYVAGESSTFNLLTIQFLSQLSDL